jgi:hypothetical protein
MLTTATAEGGSVSLDFHWPSVRCKVTYVADHDLLGRLDDSKRSLTTCRTGRDPGPALGTVVVGIEVVGKVPAVGTWWRRSGETSGEPSSTCETTSAHEATSRSETTATTSEGARASESVLTEPQFVQSLFRWSEDLGRRRTGRT